MDLATFASILSSVAALIGAIYTIWEKAQDRKKKDSGEVALAKDDDFQRFITICLLVYVTAGASTAAVGAYASGSTDTAPLWMINNLCWLVGNLTIAVMVLHRLFTK